MSDLRTDAELLRLATTLGVEPADVAIFAPAGPDALRRLAEQVSDALLDNHRGAFERVASLAERLPAPVATTLAQRVLGPVLAARATAALRPQKAAELAKRLPPEFLADVAVAIDARHVAELLARIEPDTATAVACALEVDGRFVAMGALMAELSPAALRTAAGALADGTILRAGVLVEDPVRLDEVVTALDDDRLRGLADAAAAEQLQDELHDLIDRLTGPQRERVDRLLAEQA